MKTFCRSFRLFISLLRLNLDSSERKYRSLQTLTPVYMISYLLSAVWCHESPLFWLKRPQNSTPSYSLFNCCTSWSHAHQCDNILIHSSICNMMSAQLRATDNASSWIWLHRRITVLQRQPNTAEVGDDVTSYKYSRNLNSLVYTKFRHTILETEANQMCLCLCERL